MASAAVNPESAQPTERENIQQKYEELYGTQQQPTQAQQTQPVVTQPVVATLPDELVSTISALKAGIEELKTAVRPAAQPVPKLVWVDKIREGDFEGAEKALTEHVQRSLEGKLQEVRQGAYNDALNASQAQLEMREYMGGIRAQNPDLIKFERYIEAPVATRVEQARSAGRIKSTSDFVREYKSAVDAEVAELRNLGLQFRAQGKDEATTRTREVLSSTSLTPNQVQSQTTQTQTQPESESTEGYFARRRADEARRRGLS